MPARHKIKGSLLTFLNSELNQVKSLIFKQLKINLNHNYYVI